MQLTDKEYVNIAKDLILAELKRCHSLSEASLERMFNNVIDAKGFSILLSDGTNVFNCAFAALKKSKIDSEVVYGRIYWYIKSFKS